MKDVGSSNLPLGRVALVWLATFGYALVRYVVFGPVPPESIPLYVLNKTLAFSALALFFLSCLPRTATFTARSYGLCGTWLIFAHVLLSLLLFSLRAFESFLSPDGHLVVPIQFAMLFGVWGATTLAWQHLHPTDRAVGLARTLVLTAAVGHVTCIGFEGWMTPAHWHGGLPPMTLLAACLGLAAVVLRVTPKVRKAERRTG